MVGHPDVILSARHDGAERGIAIGAIHAGERSEMLNKRAARIGIDIAGQLFGEFVVLDHGIIAVNPATHVVETFGA